MQIPYNFSDDLAMALVEKVQRKVQFSLCAGQERKGQKLKEKSGVWKFTFDIRIFLYLLQCFL